MLGRILLTTTMVAAAAVISVSPATAADRPGDQSAGASATSYLRDVSPAVIEPGDRLTLTGVVENTGDEPIENVQALPRWSDVQLENRDEVGLVGRDESVRWGLRRDDPFEVVADRLDPGERQEFQLTFDDVDEFGFGVAGAYAIGVDVRGSLTTGERVTLDTARTVIPWMPEPPPSTQVALVWPVEAPPSLLPDGALRNESLADRLEPDGPLTSIVDAAGSAPVSWLVDPDVLDTVDTMAAGYETGPASGSREDGIAAERAGEWRLAFDEATDDGTVFLLPYARPDLEALYQDEPQLAGSLARTSVEASKSVARSMDDVRTGVARPSDDEVSGDVLTTMAEAGVRTVLLSGRRVTPEPEYPLAQMATGEGDLDVVLTDPGLDAALADAYTAPNPEAAALELRQRWAAETAMAAMTADALGQPPAPMIVAPPSRWTPDSDTAAAIVDAWTSIPWVTPTALDDLEPMDRAPAVTATETETVNGLPAENVQAAGELRAAADDFTDLLTEPGSDLVEGLSLSALRSASSGWRDDPAAGVEYAGAITRELTTRLDDVRVSVPESVTLSSRAGVFPLTVTNDLDQPVTVTLAIQAANPDRLRVADVENLEVGAGARETFEVRAEAATNGKVPITVQLVTRNQSPVGPTNQTVVNATDYGTIGWLIIAGATAVFGASVLRTSLRRRRAAPMDEAASEDTEPSHAGPSSQGELASDDAPAGSPSATGSGTQATGSGPQSGRRPHPPAPEVAT